MTDQVEIHIPKTIVSEKTTFAATVYNRTRPTKASSVPTTIHYRVDCLTTEQEITDWTTVATPAAINTIVITSNENAIIDNSHALETKQLTVKLDDELSTQQIKPIQWKVRNLLGIT